MKTEFNRKTREYSASQLRRINTAVLAGIKDFIKDHGHDLHRLQASLQKRVTGKILDALVEVDWKKEERSQVEMLERKNKHLLEIIKHKNQCIKELVESRK